jgi:hypothetical protein
LDNLGIIKKPCGAHRQPPGPNHGPTASEPHRPPSDSGCHCLTVLTTPRPPPRRSPFLPPRPPPLAAIKGAQPPVNDLFFLFRPSPSLRRHFVVVELPRNAAPGPPLNYLSPPRAPHRRRELPRPPCQHPRPFLCSTTAGSPSAASAAVDSSGEPLSDPSSHRPHQHPRRAPPEFGRAAVDRCHGSELPCSRPRANKPCGLGHREPSRPGASVNQATATVEFSITF